MNRSLTIAFSALFTLGALGAPSFAADSQKRSSGTGKVTTSAKKATATPTPEKKKVNLPPLFLAQVKDEVHVIHKGDKKKVDPPQKVEKDDRIVTGKNARAYLEFQEGGTVEVGPDTDVKVDQLEVDPKTFKARFRLASGKMKAALKKFTRSSSLFEIEAGGVVAGVRGTTFGVEYDKYKKEVAAKTYEGSVFTRSGGKEQIVDKGFQFVVGGGGKGVLGALGAGDVQDFVHFLDASDKLEASKEILMKQLEKKLLDEVTKGILGKTEDGKSKINFGGFKF